MRKRDVGPRSAQERRLAERQQGAALVLPAQELDAQILRWLLHYPLQRVKDLALGLAAAETTVGRHVQSLLAAKMIESVYFSYTGQRSSWYYLTTAGIVAAAREDQLDPVLAARTWQADERSLLHLLPRFPALLAAQEFLNSLVIDAPAALAFQGHPAAVRWRWTRNYEVSMRVRRRTLRCAADVAVVLRRSAQDALSSSYPDEFYTLFLYVDVGRTGGWTRDLMTARLRNLQLYREAQASRTMFPLVIILTESDHQLERWQQAAQEAMYRLGLAPGAMLNGVLLNLARQSHHARVWRYDWRRLGTNERCHLHERLQGMTLATVPPGIFPHLVDAPAAGTQTRIPRMQIVRGNFHERRQELSTLPATPAKERELVALLGLEMNQRQRDLMLLLFAHPLMNTEELGLSLDGLTRQSVGRYLWTLEHWHCIQAVKRTLPTGESEVRWKLSPRGLRYLAASQRLPRSSVLQSLHTDDGVKEWQPGVYQLQKYLRHTAGVYGVVAALQWAALATPGHRLLWIEAQAQCAQRYLHRGAWYNFRPDSVVAYQYPDRLGTPRRVLFWIEWDGGTMDLERLRKKMAAYAHYLRSREWRRWGHETGTPVLVIVVPHQGQLARMRSAAREFLEPWVRRAELRVCLTTHSLLEERGMLASIWFGIEASPPGTPTLRWLLPGIGAENKGGEQ